MISPAMCGSMAHTLVYIISPEFEYHAFLHSLLQRCSRSITELIHQIEYTSTASANMGVNGLKEAVFLCFLQTLSNECNNICSAKEGISLFRKISVTSLASNCKNSFVHELRFKAPGLIQTLLALVSTMTVGTNQWLVQLTFQVYDV